MPLKAKNKMGFHNTTFSLNINYMEVNIQKTKIILFTRKTNNTHFTYYVSDVLILLSDCIQYLGVMLGNKLYIYIAMLIFYIRRH
jgi:hypothetical protein